MSSRIVNSTALITGGSSGIGLEYARELAARGCELILVSNREEELRDASQALSVATAPAASAAPATPAASAALAAPSAPSTPAVHTLCIDLASHGAAEKVLNWCDAKGLQPDILICNAGMFYMEYLSEENLPKAQAMMTLHAETTTELCILFGSRMKARGEGRILIMSSLTARIPAPGIAIYSATKAYLKSFGRSLSYEMRPYGVTVTTVCPAAVDTALYPLPPGLRRTLKHLGIIKSPHWLVNRALKALFKGKRTVSPGLTNLLLPPLIALLPARWIDFLGMKWINKDNDHA